jgi:hypothetical protein
MMASVRPEEARQFYEDDEDPARVFAVFDAGEKGRTASPGPRGAQRRDWGWLGDVGRELVLELRKLRLRRRVVTGLRRLADALESSRPRVR